MIWRMYILRNDHFRRPIFHCHLSGAVCQTSFGTFPVTLLPDQVDGLFWEEPLTKRDAVTLLINTDCVQRAS